MKKIILSIILLFFLYFVPTGILGQGIDDKTASFSGSIPVFSCGVAGDTTGRDKCCYTVFNNECSSPVLSYAKTLLRFIPGMEGVITDNINKCEKIREYANKVNDTPCIVGNPTIGGQPATDFSNSSCNEFFFLLFPSKEEVAVYDSFLSFL